MSKYTIISRVTQSKPRYYKIVASESWSDQWVKVLAAVSEPVFNSHDPKCGRRGPNSVIFSLIYTHAWLTNVYTCEHTDMDVNKDNKIAKYIVRY